MARRCVIGAARGNRIARVLLMLLLSLYLSISLVYFMYLYLFYHVRVGADTNHVCAE